ncbi:hypothetical protein JRI60_00985 [Archangium violaceum]|uniref:hypothetical protein n=1 Tax=Archangium violaceum TaxID=83451 RepID=UPI00194ED1D9|nr:hypothetical protein [Archangium violaceum]QRN97695.1 hypothetical protein JRI60_00985 [Archangium violaceum]
MRLAVVVLGVLLGLWPQVSHACRCVSESPHAPPAQAFRTARDKASHVYLARVHAADGLRSGGTATVEVLEVFKGEGELAVGTRLQLPSGGGGDCTFPFKKGNDYLVYAHGQPTSVRLCTRTRQVQARADDMELTWLRTGKAPVTPVALRREVVTCKPCDVDTVAGVPILGADAARRAYEEQRPFRTPGPGGDDRVVVEVGMTRDNRAFQLVQTSHEVVPTDEPCRRAIIRRWCERLAPTSDEARFAFRCIKPGPEEEVCDEEKSRAAKWMPLERLTAATCGWKDPNAPSCTLSKKLQPLRGSPKAGAPVLQCRPMRQYTERHSCQVVTGEK